MIAKTLKGLESLLAEELYGLGAENIRKGNRAVFFRGSMELMYRVNFFSRTAISVLLPVFNYSASNEQQLYDGAMSFHWDEWMDVNDTFAVNSVVHSPYFNHSQYVALKVKDAIADYFRSKTGRRPNVNVESPDFQFHVHISEDQVSLSLDSSGEPLFKRGYRKSTGPAPLNEVLAAGMIMLSGWTGETNFIDPMCGSGTLPIEAGLIAYRIPPGIFRKRFGFENWKSFDKMLWLKVTESYHEEKSIEGSVFGSDKLQGMISIARQNASSAFLSKKINFRVASIQEYSPPAGPGTLIMNPPYGKRIGVAETDTLYTIVGDMLKRSYSGYDAWILSSNFESIKHIGLKPSQKITLFNGPLECKFLKYSIYEGSKKNKNPTEK